MVVKNYNQLSGIQFVTNPEGVRTGVIIDLNQPGNEDVWEDFYDGLLARKRVNEPRESLKSVKKLLKQKGKLNE